MKRSLSLVIFSLALFLSACDLIRPISNEQKAEAAAVEFFERLSSGEYQRAAEMYAGDYAELEYMNPTLPEEDHAALWRNACGINGYQCLPIRQVLEIEKFSLNEYHLKVQFQNPDGSVFILGPCCGADEEEMPPQSEFDVYVIERKDVFYIVSLPVFVP